MDAIEKRGPESSKIVQSPYIYTTYVTARFRRSLKCSSRIDVSSAFQDGRTIFASRVVARRDNWGGGGGRAIFKMCDLVGSIKYMDNSTICIKISITINVRA
jgi:hypothetical protein